ncbi:unnamed protein product [Moneuplotes crassus]|uniref:Transmembrane protein n=2 Tax=Euplotes crassus TaxID=5936 RepID=A0AAD2CYL7_EUPCR|nr:unnamed protein product [Moneuplotes crassus]
MRKPPFGMTKSSIKRRALLKTPNQSYVKFQNRGTPLARQITDEKFKQKFNIGQDFEQSAENFFTDKKPKRTGALDTDSIYNKKTYASTDMDVTANDFIESKRTKPIPTHLNIVIENPLSNNVYFQMVIFYNFFYSFLHAFLLFIILFYKLWVFDANEYREYISTALAILYLPLELTSLYFGYRGNINETFPELIAFMVFTIFFRFPMQLGIFFLRWRGDRVLNSLFPMEYSLFYVIIVFLFLEFVFGIWTIKKVISSRTATFYLRNAKTVDSRYCKSFKAKDRQIRSSREIAIGLSKLKDNTAFENQWLKEPEWYRKTEHSFDHTDVSD